jgi:hypothetical protein
VVRSANLGLRKIKKDFVDVGGVGEREYRETILLLFRARAGSTKDIFFFIRLIGFKGYKLSNNTVLENLYDNIL